MTFVRSAILAGVLVTASAGAQGGAPTQAIVRQLVLDHYHLTSSGFSRMDVPLVEIGAPHKASAREGMQYQVSLGQTIWPVRTRYTMMTGSGPSASIRDWDTHWFVFRSVQLGGRWDLTSDSHKGDVEGNLRGW